MNSIHAMSIDPRLLQWLDLLLQEASVSRAALHADVTQSAMSHALRRLRAHFADPLLVRAGRGMTLSARAQALKGPLREALLQLHKVAQPDPVFHPAKGAHAFHLVMPDYGDMVLATPLMARLSRLAPHSSLHCQQTSDHDLLATLGQADLVIGRFEQAPQSLHQRVLWHDEFAVVSRSGHPGLQRRQLSLPIYLAQAHVQVRLTGVGSSAIDLHLAAQGLRRHIACTFAQFASAGRLVAHSDLLCTMPRRVAQALAADLPLRVHALPLPLPGHDVKMLWSPAVHREARHAWLREQVMAVVKEGRGQKG